MKPGFSKVRMFRYAMYVVLAGILSLAAEVGVRKDRNSVINGLEVKVSEVNEADNNEVNEPNEQDYKLSISQTGIDFIKKHEDFEPEPYPDGTGFSIGYGHQLKERENLTSLTKEEAYDLLMIDLKEVYEPLMHKYVKVELTQPQYDALCSFVYNFGETQFSKSTLLKKLNNKDYYGAAQEFDRWINFNGKPSEGLIKRRAKEKRMFLYNLD